MFVIYSCGCGVWMLVIAFVCCLVWVVCGLRDWFACGLAGFADVCLGGCTTHFLLCCFAGFVVLSVMFLVW